MVSKEARLIDSEFDLKWNLGNYPFDVQKLLLNLKHQVIVLLFNSNPVNTLKAPS